MSQPQDCSQRNDLTSSNEIGCNTSAQINLVGSKSYDVVRISDALAERLGRLERGVFIGY